jgi:ATP-dependent protease ClpP protease subunit
MSLNKDLYRPQAFERPEGVSWDPPTEALDKYALTPVAAEATDPNTISIYGAIGEDMYGEGFTAKRMAGALRAIGENPVTVSLNSPGGDKFEGLAIYNLLVDHPAQVTVKVMGLAASAASVIAMAGDRVEMGKGSFLMIHNAWGLVIGDSREFAKASEAFGRFDAAMAGIYAARTGKKDKDVSAMMDAETWLNASDAIAQGFADGTFDAPKSDAGPAAKATFAKRKLDAALAKTGMPRKERRALLSELSTGTQDAAAYATQDAGEILSAMDVLISNFRS